MDRSAEYKRVLTGFAGAAVAVAALYGVGRATRLWPVNQIPIWLGEGIVGLAIGLVAWGAYPTVAGVFRRHGVEPSDEKEGGRAYPTVTLTPLQHKKGARLMTGPLKVTEGKKTAWMRDEEAVTNPEVNESWSSQTWDARIPTVDKVPAAGDGSYGLLKPGQTRPLTYKFGVIRVKVEGTVAKGCQAIATIRQIEGKGRTRKVGQEFGLGALVWHTKDGRQKVLGDLKRTKELYNNPEEGINHLLKKYEKQETDINAGLTRDLQIFYMSNRSGTVFPCGEEEGTHIGESVNNRVVRFHVKLTVSANNLPAAVVRNYEARARWEDFSLTEVAEEK